MIEETEKATVNGAPRCMNRERDQPGGETLLAYGPKI
jgi:hypothetical protein